MLQEINADSKVFACNSFVSEVSFIVSNELIRLHILLCLCLEVQGAYKLSEDFAKPYFHKYWTEIHDVTNIWKRNVCSFIVTLNAFDVRPTCDTTAVQAMLPFQPFGGNGNMWKYVFTKSSDNLYASCILLNWRNVTLNFICKIRFSYCDVDKDKNCLRYCAMSTVK